MTAIVDRMRNQKKKTTSISIQDADHNFSAKDDIVLVYGCSFDHLAMVKN